MMRGYRGGEECDAFSRKARRIMTWKGGALRIVKRRFWKRTRRLAKTEAASDATS
jgi:hypothetical protein